MNTNHDIETKLEHLSGVVSLRADEKALHRENLTAFMAKGRKPVRSPYAWLLTPATRYTSALMLLFIIGTSGTLAAEGSRPGDALYLVKLKVTEPTRSALILNPREKTAFELERTDKRLKEFASYAQATDADAGTVALIASSLEESIGEITKDVTEYTQNGDADIALAANAGLQSMLSAHRLVLTTIATRNPGAADDVERVSASVHAGIADTENAEQGIEDALTETNADEAAVSEQADATSAALEALRIQISEYASSLSPEDLVTVEELLALSASIIEEADAARASAHLEEALLLYIEADQRLSELQTLIEADQDLGIGVIEFDRE